MKFKVDESNRIEKVFNKVVEKEFPELGVLKFLYVWREQEKLVEGQLVVAEVFKLTTRDRDLWGFDVRVEVDETTWPKMDSDERRKLAFHELLHIRLQYETDDNGEENKDVVKYDSDERVCFYIEEHDLILKRFKRELKKFGLSSEEEKMRRFLNKVHSKRSK